MEPVRKVNQVTIDAFLKYRDDKHNFCIEMERQGSSAKYSTNQRKWNLLHALQSRHEAQEAS